MRNVHVLFHTCNIQSLFVNEIVLVSMFLSWSIESFY